MEGRLQPPSIDEHHAVTQLPLSPGRADHHTYVVQVPKDQVYRVPPPKNTVIAAQHRKPTNKKNPNTCYRSSWFFISLAILIVIALIITALYFIFKPKLPQFFVTKFEVKKPPTTTTTTTSKKNAYWVPHYLVSMRAENPNGRSGLSYAKDGGVSMYYNSIAVATGKFPGLDQEPGDSSPVKIELSGSKDRPLNADMRRSMNTTSKSHVAISFELEMKLEVKGRIGGIKIYRMNPTVNCKIKMSSLRDDARVLSQECN
ncbi:NDR1/HIN1-like protein 13 [Prosopis cineraria]|uniref:NDR1/HIN1-like protein 13 n=1 Tax=Prosopis cineraria TaxID=364024 RepID=UPI00240FADA4|nr:NDR1/HIN1-like protein 13 [Prosopis cineraria]